MKSILICIAGFLVAALAQASSVRPIKGVDVIVKKRPGNTASRMVTSDSDGTFTVRGLDAGSYTLTFNPCPYANGERYDASKSNVITSLVLANPGVKSISVELSHITCAASEGMPLRAAKNPAGGLKVKGVLAPEVFAAGINVDVEIGSEGVVSGIIAAELP